MRKTITISILIALLLTFVWACGCGTEKSADEKDTTTPWTTEEEASTTETAEEDTTTTGTTGGELEPGPRYDPYTPIEGEMVTTTDYDLGLREGYEAGYWAGLADGMRGVYNEEPMEYDDSNEFYVEGLLEGYQEGYEDGYSDGEEI